MARTGRPPKPIELHRRHGTYRADRHGPKLATVAPGRTAPLLAVIAPGEVQDFVCADCGEPLAIELYADGRWRRPHADGQPSCA